MTEPDFSEQEGNLTLTKSELSQTKQSKGGRPRKAPNVIPWTVRGVDAETRTAIEKAASKGGKTIGQYMNEDLRSYAQDQLKKAVPTPVRQDDLRDELDNIKSMLNQIVERIPEKEGKSFFKRIFG